MTLPNFTSGQTLFASQLNEIVSYAEATQTTVDIINLGAISTGLSETLQDLFIGTGAGAAFNLSGASGYSSTGIGTGALQSLTANNAENVAVGAWALQYLTTGTVSTAVGMHAGGSENSVGITAIGNDSMRDCISYLNGGYTTAVGQGSMAHGNPGNGCIAIGGQSLRGNSGGWLISGTITTGDTITLTISASGSTPGSVIGLPYSYTYTVSSGDTLTTIATNIASHINNSITGNSYFVAANGSAMSDGTAVVWLTFPGSTSTGWTLTLGSSTSVGATETITNLPGSSPRNSIAIGNNACIGFAMQTVTGLTVVGDHAGNYITTGGYNSLYGFQSGQNLTSGGNNTFIGALCGEVATTSSYCSVVGMWSLDNMTTGSFISVVGAKSGQSITTATYATILGFQIGSTTFATGTGVILIGSGLNAVDTPSSSTSNYINIENILTVTGTNTPSTSTATFAGNLDVTGAIVAPSIGNTTTALEISGSGSWSNNGSVATTMTSLGPTGSHTTIQTWFTVKDNNGVLRYIPAY